MLNIWLSLQISRSQQDANSGVPLASDLQKCGADDLA